MIFQKPIPLPKLQSYEFPDFWGVVNNIDAASQPRGSVPFARNLRFDKGKPRLRPGLDHWKCLLDDGLTGISQWVFPKGADQPETRHLLAFGSAGVGIDRVPVVLKNTGLAAGGPDAWEICTVRGRLLGADQDTHAFQLRDKLYCVNGLDGLFYYSGMSFRGYDFNVLQTVPVNAGPTLEALSLPVNEGSAWVNHDAAKLLVANAPVGTRDSFDPALRQQNLTILANADASWSYSYTNGGAQGLNLIADADGIERRARSIVFVLSNFDGDTNYQRPNFRVILGRNDGGTSDPADPAWAFDPAKAYSWEFSGDSTTVDPLVELPLDGVDDAILAKADYIVIQITKIQTSLGAGGFEPYTVWNFSSFQALGSVPDGVTFYRSQLRDTLTNLTGEASDPQRVEAIGPEITGTEPNVVRTTVPNLLGSGTNTSSKVVGQRTFYQKPKTFIKATLTFQFNDPEEMDLYRNLNEEAASLTDGDGLQYHFVQTIAKPAGIDEGESGDVVFYDNTSEAQLRANAALNPRQQSSGIPEDPPRFITGSNTRLAVACSNAHPYRVWLSDIQNELSFPNEPFTQSKVVGLGGYIDVFNQEAITGLTTLRNNFVVFTETSVYLLKVTFEATGDETWNLIKISTNGMPARRGYCHIPGGMMWASANGVYYVYDTVEQVSQVPLSLDIQHTWNGITAAGKRSISMEYNPEEHIVLIATNAYPSATPDNHNILVFDLRAKSPTTPFGAWAGEWVCVNDALPALSYLQPKQIYCALDRDGVWQTYILRYSEGSIDRLKVPGVDADPYEDYGSNIRAELWTGWINPNVGGTFRPMARTLRIAYDPTPVGVDGTLKVTVECRNPLVSKTYTHPLLAGADTSGGVIGLGGNRKRSDFDPRLRGNEIRLKLFLSAITGGELRFDGLKFDLQYLGDAGRDGEGATTPATLPDLDCVPDYTGLTVDDDGDFDWDGAGPGPEDPGDNPGEPETNVDLPAGIILFWDSRNGAIPAGWNVCDGTLGTIDLITDNPLIVMGSVSGKTLGVLKNYTHARTDLFSRQIDGLLNSIDTFFTNAYALKGASSAYSLANSQPLLAWGAPDDSLYSGPYSRDTQYEHQSYFHGNGAMPSGFDRIRMKPTPATFMWTRIAENNPPAGTDGYSSLNHLLPLRVPSHTHVLLTAPTYDFAKDASRDILDRYQLIPVMSTAGAIIPAGMALFVNGETPPGFDMGEGTTKALALTRGYDFNVPFIPFGRMFLQGKVNASGHQLSDETPTFVYPANGAPWNPFITVKGKDFTYSAQTSLHNDATTSVKTSTIDENEGGNPLVKTRGFDNPIGHNHVLNVHLYLSGRATSITLKGYGLTHVNRATDITDWTGISKDLIFFWDLSKGPVPDGWLLCDGTNGYDDLVTGNPFVELNGDKSFENVQGATTLFGATGHSGGFLWGLTPHPGDHTLDYDVNNTYVDNSGEYNEAAYSGGRRPVGGNVWASDGPKYLAADDDNDASHGHYGWDYAVPLSQFEFFRDNITRYTLLPIKRV